MAVLNNLYPPVVDTYAPAFLTDSGNTRKDTCRVYFSISAFNVLTDIMHAQVTVSNQYTNISVLNEEKYPCDIMLTQIGIDSAIEGDNKYYIDIKKTDIEGGQFEINTYYKVQIRFCSTAANEVSLTIPQAIDSWLAANQQYFSEWSSVCLVRGISTPILTIRGFDTTAESTLWTTTNVDVIGKLTFKDELEEETLKDYRIKLYDNLDQLLIDTDNLYSNNYSGINEINYTFKYSFQEGEEYTLEIEYTTKNLYSDILTFNFMVIESGSEKLNADLSAIIDEDNGRIGINIKGPDDDFFTGNITIRRTSSRSNFTLWEDMYTVSIENKLLDLTWYDYTIESGVWYKYGAQRRDSLGNRGIMNLLDEEYMIVFEHMFLDAGNKQIRVQFNPQLQSFQRTKSEARTDTLGSKYTFVKRNGNTDYKQFPISGLISFFMDEDKIFCSREEIYQEQLELYNNYNSENRITPINDTTYERDFREKVMDFLYENNVKLFRSSTEGNILVKLMDITFSPDATLGRHIYTFNCQAYEIDEFNIENCDKYGIQSLGEIDEYLSYTKDYIAQYNEIIPSNTDVITLLNEYYQKYAEEGYVAKVDYLDHLRLEMESKPYLIYEGEDGPIPVNDKTRSSDAAAAILGYIVYINEQPIIINPEGIYELKGEDIKITSLSFPVETTINLDYHVSVSQTEDKSQLAQSSNYYKRVGQLWGAFGYKDSIYQEIWNKYYEKYSNYMQSVISIDSISVEADPGTVVYVKESEEKDFQRHVIGETARLDFNNEDETIEGVYFAGIHFEPATEAEQERENVPWNKFIEVGHVHSLESVENPVRNGVYYLDDLFLNVYPQLNDKSAILKTTGIDEKLKSANVPEDRIQTISSGILAAILKREVVLIYEDTVVIDESEIEFIKSIERLGYKVVTVGKDDDKELIYVVKQKMNQNQDNSYSLTINKIIDNDFALILEEQINNSNKFIWYNSEWWAFTDNHDLICPIQGLINYCCEIVKGMYAI